MPEAVDQYINEVVRAGDKGSALLAALCAPTLNNCRYVDIVREGMNGIAVLRVPDDSMVVAFSASGDPAESDPARHAESMVDELFNFSRRINAEPLGFADDINASTGNIDTVRAIGEALVRRSNEYGISVLNGELAVLGDRVNCPANITGTMVALIPKSSLHTKLYPVYAIHAFDPEGRPVYMNSDGVGTKTEFYERAKTRHRALRDSAAMKADDAVKIAAEIQAVFDVIETSSEPDEAERRYFFDESRNMSINYNIRFVNVGERLQGWPGSTPDDVIVNIGGSAVSTIDEDRLRNPPAPQEGDYVIAVRGKPNPRSNGITDKRKAMVRQFGHNWHNTDIGMKFLEFLAEPSTVFYPVFSELIRDGVATSVYHMSGGAYEGKLAKPLAKHGLYVSLADLFQPDWRELALGGFLFTPAEVAYAKWPMGNEGFVTTQDITSSRKIIELNGLEYRVVGRLERAQNGRTGVELAGVKASTGSDVYFPGR